jgi:hypothetical protein
LEVENEDKAGKISHKSILTNSLNSVLFIISLFIPNCLLFILHDSIFQPLVDIQLHEGCCQNCESWLYLWNKHSNGCVDVQKVQVKLMKKYISLKFLANTFRPDGFNFFKVRKYPRHGSINL